MAEAPQFSKQGDRVVDGQIYRAGLKVIHRKTLLDPKDGFGKGVYKDLVENTDGSPGTRYWTDYPEGATMVLPVKSRLRTKSSLVILGTNMLLYGIGDANGTEALGSRIRIGGQERTAEDAVNAILSDKQLSVKKLTRLGSERGVNDTSGRQQNWTELFTAEIDTLPTEKQLREQDMVALTLADALRLIKSGVIANGVTIATIHLTREYLKDQHRPATLLRKALSTLIRKPANHGQTKH